MKRMNGRILSPGLTALAIALATLTAAGQPARADEPYPARPVNLLVPYPAGGIVDVIGRVFAESLGQTLGQPVIALNRPGANGKVALGELARGAADGYTLLVNMDGGLAIPPAVDPLFKFTPDVDYRPIAQIADAPYVLAVRAGLPVKSVAELVAYARAHPGALNYGSPGTATTPHMAMEMLTRETGIAATHVPFQGGAPALTDLLGEGIDMLVASASSVRGFANSDRIRILAVLNDTRLPWWPDLPTLKETGFPTLPISGWVGVFGPSKTPPAALARIDAGLTALAADPRYRARIEAIGADARTKDGAAFPDFFRGEVRKWARFAADTGIKLEN